MSDPILIIKLGAFGDIIQAMGPMKAIRAHHSGAPITLLTRPAFAGFLDACPYVDRVWRDEGPKLTQLGKVAALRAHLRAPGFSRVYDLQNSDRTSFYFRLFLPGPLPEWSGAALGASHRHANPNRKALHTLDRQAEQLAIAGIADLPAPDLAWAAPDLNKLDLPGAYAVLVPGAAPHRPDKRWPWAHFAETASALKAIGLTPVLVGGPDEQALHADIIERCPEARSLAGRTDLLDLPGVMKGARLAIGNDTGPMHVAAACGIPCVSLFSSASDPLLCGPRGKNVTTLFSPVLDDLPVKDVLHAAGL